MQHLIFAANNYEAKCLSDLDDYRNTRCNANVQNLHSEAQRLSKEAVALKTENEALKKKLAEKEIEIKNMMEQNKNLSMKLEMNKMSGKGNDLDKVDDRGLKLLQNDRDFYSEFFQKFNHDVKDRIAILARFHDWISLGNQLDDSTQAETSVRRDSLELQRMYDHDETIHIIPVSDLPNQE
jgi:regulator of replication initiation timing